MGKSCCGHAEQTKSGGFAVHDSKCENGNNGQLAKSASANSGDSCCGSDDSGGSGSDDEDDCCSSHSNHHLNNSNHEHSHADVPVRTKEVIQKKYKVDGMDCPSCAASIEKALNGKDGIISATIHYSVGKLNVEGSNDAAFIQVEDIVRKLGFQIEEERPNRHERVYDVEGMDCSSCALSIEKHLNSFDAVREAHVNFASGTLTADHSNPSEEIIKEIEKLGYKARLKSAAKEETDSSLLKGYGTIISSGILIAAGFVIQHTTAPALVSILLYAAAIVLSGYKPMKSAWYAVKSKSLDMNVLMSSAAIGAAIIGEWFEGATVVFLFALGTALQTSSLEKTRRSIRGLMDLAPDEAWVKQGTELVKKRADEITIDEIIIIKPGDRIPLDGTIIEGHSSINQAPITGESIPVEKQIGDTAFAGTINESGSLEIKVTKLANDTAIARIIHQVEEAQDQRAPAQAFIDRFSHYYTPIVFSIALALIVLPPLFGFGTWSEWVYRGLALLIVACPCALVISTPVAIVSAIGNAARNGVLIKGGTFLEKAGTIDAIAFDKTGTLTEGKPQVTDVITNGVTESELLEVAFTLEDYSTHPIAKTIVAHAKDKGIKKAEGHAFSNLTGKGVQAEITGTIHYAGNIKLFDALGTDLKIIREQALAFQKDGKTIVIIGTAEKALGIIAVADTIRETAVRSLKELRKTGVKQLIMLTGDNKGTAEKVANGTDINRYFAELMPEDKVKAIKQLQQEGHHVAMVGDGINDAPALATADIGIAMGGAGTDTAMETADIVLMADNLEQLPHTMKLSRRALNIIKQNIWFSILIKLAALVLIVPGWLTLWMAVLSDTGAAVIVVLNALRLLKVK